MTVKRPYAFVVQHTPTGETVVLVTNVPMLVDDEETALEPETAEILSEIAGAAKMTETLRWVTKAYVNYDDWVRGNHWFWQLATVDRIVAQDVEGSK